jgi:hypothetical protein
VPVLRRQFAQAEALEASPSRTEAGSPLRPAVYCCSPQWMRPLRKVPVVTMVAAAWMLRPSRSLRPMTLGAVEVTPSAASAEASRTGR